MRLTDTRPALARNLALAAILLAALAACAEPQKPLENCEPGVNELSDMSTVAPGNC